MRAGIWNPEPHSISRPSPLSRGVFSSVSIPEPVSKSARKILHTCKQRHGASLHAAVPFRLRSGRTFLTSRRRTVRKRKRRSWLHKAGNFTPIRRPTPVCAAPNAPFASVFLSSPSGTEIPPFSGIRQSKPDSVPPHSRALFPGTRQGRCPSYRTAATSTPRRLQ